MTAAHFNQVPRVHFCHVGAAGGVIQTALSTDYDLSQSIYSRFAPLFFYRPAPSSSSLSPSLLLPLQILLYTFLFLFYDL